MATSERMGDGGPAFPVVDRMAAGVERDPRGTPACAGMTLRDYAAFHSPVSLHDAMVATGQGSDLSYCLQGEMLGNQRLFRAHAKLAYQWADAMLAARSQP